MQWTKISGRGTVTFGSPSAKSSTAVFSSVGTYVLRLTASDGALSRADDLQITVYEPALAGAVITGTVHDKRNQAAIGALVEGRVNGKVVCYGSTDATGSYRFPSISAGTYSMHAELAGQKGDNSNCAVFYPDVSYVNKPPAVCNININ
ncbi:MAG: carboxypeptidase-like regulatory domain-containing protein [Verrucomicrobiota bacterium]